MDLFYYLGVLWRRKWIIILVPLISGFSAFYLRNNIPEKYRSVAQIATGFTRPNDIKIDNERFSLRNAEMKFSNLLASIKAGINYNLLSYRLILHDLESDEPFRVVDQSIFLSPDDRLLIKEQFERKLAETEVVNPFWEDGESLINVLKAYGYHFAALSKNLNISRVSNTDYIQVEFTSENPHLSAYAVNAFCEEFLKYYGSVVTERSGESVDFFRNLVQEKKSILDSKAEQLKQFKSDNSLVNLQIESESHLTQLVEYENLKNAEVNNIKGLKLSLENIENKIQATNNTQVSDNGGVSDNLRIIQLKNRINALNSKIVTSNSNNQVLLDSISSLRSQLQAMLDRSTTLTSDTEDVSVLLDEKSKLEIDLVVAEENLKSLNAKMAFLQLKMRDFSSKENIISTLEREIQMASQEYLKAQEKLNLAESQHLITGSSLRQIVSGVPAAHPEASKTLLISGLATFASFGVCLVLIILFEVIDIRLKTPANFGRLVNIPLAGTLNLISKPVNLKSLFTEKNANKEQESFKQFLRKIRHQMEGAGSKVFLVTSTKSGEGKSQFILYTALTLSKIGKRILIVDTNFKNNTLTRVLMSNNDQTKRLKRAVINEQYLLEGPVIEGHQTAKKENRSIINHTQYPNVDIIGNNKSDDSASEILSGRNFEEMLATFRSHYDYIFMEGSAMNDYSDTQELVSYTDKVIPIFSADSQIKQMDRDSIQYLNGLGDKLWGAILNKVDLKNLAA